MAPLAHLAWRDAMVAAVVDETADARSLVLDVPHWPGHVAGQHVDVRLTAPDGYQATRSYSLSSGPGEAPTITVQEVEDGEVSTYLVRDIAVGDTLGVRGPIGGYFVWAGQHRPAAPRRRRLRARPAARDVAGGRPHGPGRRPRVGDHPGPAPLRHRARRPGPRRNRLRHRPPVAVGRATGCRAHRYAARAVTLRPGRVDAASVEAAVVACGGAEADPAVFVCGPTSFVEALVDLLGAAGLDPRTVRAERFG